MQLSTHIEALLADLAAAGSLGDEAVAQAAQRLSEALQASARLRLLDLLSEATLEISDQLPTGHVEIRLAGQEPSLVYVETLVGSRYMERPEHVAEFRGAFRHIQAQAVSLEEYIDDH